MFLRRLLTRRQMCLACCSLLLGVALAFSAGRWLAAQQQAGQALRADTLRLHILPASDSVRDQTIKLMIRDCALTLTEELCADAACREDALCRIARSLPRYQLAAGRVLARFGAGQAVRIRFANLYFDAASYGQYTLPAGRYDAVQIELGEGRHGHNWWCVLYPGLCLSAFSSYDTPEENDLVCGEYLLRFRAVDLFEQLTAPREQEILLTLE